MRELWYSHLSGWRDSNSRPPAPKAGSEYVELIRCHIEYGDLICRHYIRRIIPGT